MVEPIHLPTKTLKDYSLQPQMLQTYGFNLCLINYRMGRILRLAETLRTEPFALFVLEKKMYVTLFILLLYFELSFFNIQEKYNIWVALINLEHKYGSMISLENVFKRAVSESKVFFYLRIISSV